VICEKPLGRTADESFEIWQRVAATGVRHMCAFNYRFVPAVRLAREMIEAGEIGDLVRSGKLRPIAQIAAQRIDGFPDVPTLREEGFKIPDVPQARGLVGPPDMPPEALKYYSDLFRKITESQSWRDYMKQTQTQNAYLDSGATRKFMEEYTGLLRDVLKSANIQLR
jgi:putative tricarboxylic transport membrane protein